MKRQSTEFVQRLEHHLQANLDTLLAHGLDALTVHADQTQTLDDLAARFNLSTPLARVVAQSLAAGLQQSNHLSTIARLAFSADPNLHDNIPLHAAADRHMASTATRAFDDLAFLQFIQGASL